MRPDWKGPVEKKCLLAIFSTEFSVRKLTSFLAKI
jgi:hypothetical protein